MEEVAMWLPGANGRSFQKTQESLSAPASAVRASSTSTMTVLFVTESYQDANIIGSVESCSETVELLQRVSSSGRSAKIFYALVPNDERSYAMRRAGVRRGVAYPAPTSPEQFKKSCPSRLTRMLVCQI